MDNQFSTPILFVIFNRPQYTQIVFNEIRKIRPKYLYIAADGPRKDNIKDVELCRQVRSITGEIDWDCDVHTLFREQNLGCKLGVSSAITWFFENVEEGIILEDDCLPHVTFFGYCEKLLEKYRNDERIMMIGGTNYFPDEIEIPESYFFSRWYVVWGWASWRRAWHLYDIQMNDWPKFRDQKYLDFLIPHKRARQYYEIAFQKAYSNEIDVWSLQWWYTCIFQNGLVITPKVNLISNIGEYGHFSDGIVYQGCLSMPTRSLDIEAMVHPVHVIPHVPLTTATFDVKIGTRKKDILRTIKRTIIQFYGNPVGTARQFLNLLVTKHKSRR
jgi:hypothetical protein